jgi:hypothetical protein
MRKRENQMIETRFEKISGCDPSLGRDPEFFGSEFFDRDPEFSVTQNFSIATPNTTRCTVPYRNRPPIVLKNTAPFERN